MTDTVTITAVGHTVTITEGQNQTVSITQDDISVEITEQSSQTVIVTGDPSQTVTITQDASRVISVSGDGLSYDSSTGTITFTQPVVGIDKGGTGKTTASEARTALGADNASNLTKGQVGSSLLTSVPVTTFSDVTIIDKTAGNIVYMDGANVTARAPSNWNLTDFTNDLTSGDLPAHTHAASEITSGSLSIDLTPAADLTYSIGTEALRWLDIHGDLDGAVTFRAKNDSGGTLTVGDIVYINGVSGSVPTVALADCSDPAKMPAFGMVRDATVNPNAETHVVSLGSVESVDVPSGTYTLGTNVYVGTAGTFTDTAPTGEGNLIQNIGYVARVNSGGGPSGIIKVGGAGRTNAVPNLNSGNIFYGNGSNQAVATSLASVAATAAQGTLADSALQDVVDDTTPQLGGNLDVNGQSIVSASAGNILITPDTTGKIVLDGLSWPTADGTADQVLKTDGLGQLSFTTPAAGGGTEYFQHPDATTVRYFDDLISRGINNSTLGYNGEVCDFSGSSWSWSSIYSTGRQEWDADDALGVMWAEEAGAYDRGTAYGPISVLRYAPSDGDKCLFECRVKFQFNASAVNSFLAVGFISWDNGDNQQNSDLGAVYSFCSMAGIKFDASQTYLRSFFKDNHGTAAGVTTADITSVTKANDTWYRMAAVCTYDATNTRWQVDSYLDGTLVDTQYLTTWGPPPTYGICCYNNGSAVANRYYIDWVSCEYTRWTTPTLLHLEDV